MKSLRDRIARYMQDRHTLWIPKGVICDVARDSNLGATGEHTGRRLRELCEDGVLDVRYNKKGQAEYRYKVRQLSLAGEFKQKSLV